MNDLVRGHARALVVGVGSYSADILDHIHAEFDRHGGTEVLQLLWLPPYHDEQSSCADVLPLTLDHKILNDLYYEKNTRIWSSTNWKGWGAKLSRTRLLGRLAVHHYLPQIQSQINNQIQRLISDDSSRLNIYLVAHLHDPFASGGFLDVAYLLHKLAIARTHIRVSGILLLPEIPDDPIVAECKTDADKRLYQATTYAALKELNFHLGKNSFYKNHHPQPIVTIKKTDKPPFFTGDCYLLGGTLDKSIGYSDVIHQIAGWVYLQSMTPIRDEIVHSGKGHHFISTFAVRSMTDSANAVVDVGDQIIREVLVRVNSERETVETVVDVRDIIAPPSNLTEATARDLRAGINSIGFLAGEDNQASPYDKMRRFEEQYAAVVDKMMQYEKEETGRLQRHLKSVLSDISPSDSVGRLYQLRQEPGVTLHTLEENYRRIEEQIRNKHDELSASSTQGAEVRRALKNRRHKFEYVIQPKQLAVYYGLLAIFSILIAGFLLVVGLVIQMVIWLLLMLAIPRIVFNLLHIHQQNAEKALVKAQANLADLQNTIIRTRVDGQYYYELSRQVSVWLQTDDMTENRVAQVRDCVRELIKHYDKSDKSRPGERQVTSDEWRAFSPKLVDLLWNRVAYQSTAQRDHTSLEVEIKALIHKYNIQYQSNDDVEFFERMLSVCGSSTSLNLLLSDTSSEDIVGVVNWSLATLRQVKNLSRNVDITDLYNPDTSDCRALVYIRLKKNVPIYKLYDIETWHTAYMERATIADDTADVLTQYGFLHPLRLGVATPRIHPPLDVTFRLPHPAMFITVLLRLKSDFKEWENLAKKYHIAFSPTVDVMPLSFDELCGAIQMDIAFLIQFARAVHQNAIHLAVAVENITKIVDLIDKLPPKESELHADWEIHIIDEIRALHHQLEAADVDEAMRQNIIGLGTMIDQLGILVEVKHG